MPRVIITVPEKSAQPYRFNLDRKVVTFGRGAENDIVIDSGSVSGAHAEMHRIVGGYQLSDLGSTNGIKFNGTRELILPLQSGMTAMLGDVAFDFSLSEEELEELASELPYDRVPAPMQEEIEIPAPVRRRSPARQTASRRQEVGGVPSGGGGGFGMILLFLILAAGAFFAGLAVRHEKDTGESLISAMLRKGGVGQEAPPAGEAPPAR